MHSWEFAIRYHDATKHHFQRYARSAGHLDWANQPDPFRRFRGAPCYALPFADPEDGVSLEAAYARDLPTAPLNLSTVGAFCELSLGLSAWKQFQGARWALRCNPSSGNLHPTEGYLILPPLPGWHDQPGIYHYAPKQHMLECRTTLAPEVWSQLVAGLPAGSFLFALSSIHWREAWKYGERAFRYCQHDVGHALIAAAYAAATLGRRVRSMSAISDDMLARLLGLDRDESFLDGEREQPDLLSAVVPGAAADLPLPPVPAATIDVISGGDWHGAANRLSATRTDWTLIDAITDACRKPVTPVDAASPAAADFACGSGLPDAPNPACPSPPAAGTIIRQRRSATAMDGVTALSADRFYALLARTMPNGNDILNAAIGPPTHVHLLLFVHRVTGLTPGLYCLIRRSDHLARLRSALRSDFEWLTPPGCPARLPLYQLALGDCAEIAANLSCGQQIASHGVFSVAMLAEFAVPLEEHGGWYYRRLFWETGGIGQVLYLEAEAAGVRGTGIGCFFDDPLHTFIGLSGHAFQSLYHFAVGGPVDDARLTTSPAYDATRRAVPTGLWTLDDCKGPPCAP